MATIEQIASRSKLFLDANIVIYNFEGTKELKAAVRDALEVAAARQCQLITSELSIAECLFGAFKRDSEVLLRGYRSFFRDHNTISLVPITADLLEHAAELGASLGMKTVDAIHVASALKSACDAILSNDRALRAPSALKMVSLDSPR